MLLFYISILVSAGASLATAAAVDRTAGSSPLSDYEFYDLEWDIEVAPGRHEVLTGTVEEVIAKATELNPSFMATLEPQALDAADNKTALADANGWVGGTLKCHEFLDEGADIGRIRQGIDYLNRLRSKPRVRPGPRLCARVSCSHNSAINICNDNKDWIELQNWQVVTGITSYIIDACSAPGDKYLYGQFFTYYMYNILIRLDAC
ncbi:hypothetical protein M011DRAFT_472737 [Sporormia fimetaria CBS 119925]|uniref:Uncharacterized protein n=1 Tax=Sporormia fimetaria CBS 119925 TaxID=1340428 RepID=A0A6A6UUN0_9PLEO|nr:hypothetical protein M011DRAFT_472737 [Sporormia fimetaria CBS 119925]